jgi:hypothetical protein
MLRTVNPAYDAKQVADTVATDEWQRLEAAVDVVVLNMTPADRTEALEFLAGQAENLLAGFFGADKTGMLVAGARLRRLNARLDVNPGEEN